VHGHGRDHRDETCGAAEGDHRFFADLAFRRLPRRVVAVITVAHDTLATCVKRAGRRRRRRSARGGRIAALGPLERP
jgi:hypothetical protein